MKQSILKISKIIVKKGFYPREEINEQIVKEYAHEMNKGSIFPNIYVALFKKEYLLVDGKHRLESYKLNGEQYVQCDIKVNFENIEQIYMASVRANLKHGLRLRLKDKIRIAHKLTEFNCEIGDISKLLKIDVPSIEKFTTKKVQHIFIKDKLKSGEIPSIIKEKLPEKETIKVVDDREIRKLEKANRKDWQIYELNETYKYFNTEKFDLNVVKIENLIRNIKKVLKKKFPKL